VPRKPNALSSVVFGYMVGHFGNYNKPFIPMVALLCLGAMFRVQVGPSRNFSPM
jgi:hypothetical protein